MIILDKDVIKKEKDFKCIFLFIMTIITFIIGCGFTYLTKGDVFSVKLKSMFFGYLPAVIFLVLLLVYYFKCNTEKSKDIISIISIILTSLLLFYYIFTAAMLICEEFKNPVNDVKYYKANLNRRLLKVFPKEIPDNVENVKFICILGGNDVALYYIDRDMTIDKFDKKYRSKAVWIGHVKEYNEKNGLLGDAAFSNTPSQYENEDDYIIYLVEGQCYKPDSCNHGDFLFAAFNEKTNEVIFKSENW